MCVRVFVLFSFPVCACVWMCVLAGTHVCMLASLRACTVTYTTHVPIAACVLWSQPEVHVPVRLYPLVRLAEHPAIQEQKHRREPGGRRQDPRG